MTEHDIQGIIWLLIILVVVPLMYFLPALIASKRGHKNTASIAVCVCFLGWTFIGWVLTLAWALSDNVQSKGKHA